MTASVGAPLFLRIATAKGCIMAVSDLSSQGNLDVLAVLAC